ncbi:MAG: hypothetical protein CMQ20_12300 [Gammaproteobacteria bacterium]|jgi:hypothetical protein|nr:hypothetical protein [Gammaproteobacteria bacterium]|tara:strand:+ start:1331 stop:2458 length:1128 start_codon:yes stop_codon:yes gene_type:complete
MISALDDTLHHQTATTFDHVYTSDHRFYDRYWFSIFAENGEVMVVTTMGIYKNSNVLDGAGCVLDTTAGRQHNLRVSRQLRPDMDRMGAGPLHFELLEPLKRHRIRLEENDFGHAFELEFEAAAPPHEESHYYHRRDGRLVQDYTRFDQAGSAAGWVSVNGKRYEASKTNWSAVRDHSWGLRYQHAGGFEPTTASEPPPPAMGGLFNWMLWQGNDYTCWFLLNEGGEMWHPLDSSLMDLSGDQPRELRLTSVEHELQFYSGTRRVKSGTYLITDEEGRKREINISPVKEPFAYVGPGYGYGGFHDGKGHGVYRGLLHTEGEVWDVSDPGVVRDLDGDTLPYKMGEGPIRVQENGIVTYGHLAASLVGPYPRYGFT